MKSPGGWSARNKWRREPRLQSVYQRLCVSYRRVIPRIPGTIFLFWDGLNTHRTKKTRAALEKHRPRLRVYRLPAYAPELNPDEGLWAWLKQRALAGQCPPNVEALEHSIRLALRRLRRRPQIIRSFFHRCSLSF